MRAERHFIAFVSDLFNCIHKLALPELLRIHARVLVSFVLYSVYFVLM